MSEAGMAVVKSEMKSYIWLQTSDGSIQQVEEEVAMFCPMICREIIHKGTGSSKNCAISLPERVNPAILGFILDYCRFHQVPGRSNRERKTFDEGVFLWLAMRERLVTKEFLWSRHMLEDEAFFCPLCGVSGESVQHLFLHCQEARKCWDVAMQWLGTSWCCPRSLGELWGSWPGLMPRRHAQVQGMWKTLFYAIAWSIWLMRNQVVFQQATFNVRKTVNTAFSYWFRWLRSREHTFPYSLATMMLTSSWLFCWDRSVPNLV